MCCCLLLVVVGALGVASAVLAAHRARAAADLAAVAAAARVVRGDLGSACEVAGQVSRRNHAELVSCAVTADVVAVQVAVDPTGWPTPARADARAGPEEAVLQGSAADSEALP
ncbi:hypothetical protein ADJ73_07165 [Arsenicicoccus sp. oral taxon 190]|nr:hypothetical protein ADJ73_07165 [Arsenicicoccus sp. oral taxon 190]